MIQNLHPVYQALIASLFTWGLTALGAALVFVLPTSNKVFLDASLGFAGGVMTAASFWSLLAPAIEISQSQMGKLAFIPVTVGFTLGALFISSMIPWLTSVISGDQGSNAQDAKRGRTQMRRGEQNYAVELAEVGGENEPKNTAERSSELGTNSSGSQGLSWRSILLLIVAVTMQNFPEGLAVGVGFGGVGKTPSATFEKAFNLAFGIGLESFPEGLAVSLPLAAFGYSKGKAFFYGQLSGIVEPIAALIGSSLALMVEIVLPYALSSAAGAMIYVVFDSIIPEAHSRDNGKMSALLAIFGFTLMMFMDVVL